MDPDHVLETADSQESAQAKLRQDQKLRKRRIGMSTLSYSVSFSVVVFCAIHGLLP